MARMDVGTVVQASIVSQYPEYFSLLQEVVGELIVAVRLQVEVILVDIGNLTAH